MSYLNRFFSLSKKFGFIYSLTYSLFKLHLIKEIPYKFLLKKQQYYKNLPLEQQKKELAESYYVAMGKYPDIENPITYTEKIQWMKFYDSTQLKSDLADKYLAPILLQKKQIDINFIKQLGVWSRAEDINFDKLPEKFVLKCNHGSAMNIIIKDKSTINTKKIIKKLNQWLSIDFAYVNGMFENHYSAIIPRIIAEEYIEEMDGNLHDYKIHCFMGEPKFIEYVGDRIPNTHIVHSTTYDIEWNNTHIQFNNDVPYGKECPIPLNLKEIINLSKLMSKDFYYVRVDFYIINNKIYFGELTFTPESGFITFNNDKIDREWGDLIDIKYVL